jgi:hypothetical protein
MKKKPLNQEPSAWPVSPEEDPLWKLLGSAPLEEPEGWFTARTLARLHHQPKTSWWVLPRWIWAGSLACLLLTSSGFYLYQQHCTTEVAKTQEAFELLLADTDTEGTEWIGY